MVDRSVGKGSTGGLVALQGVHVPVELFAEPEKRHKAKIEKISKTDLNSLAVRSTRHGDHNNYFIKRVATCPLDLRAKEI